MQISDYFSSTLQVLYMIPNKLYYLLLIFFVVPIISHAQTLQVTGKVTQMDSGEQLAGVSIKVKGTDVSVFTNQYG